MVPVKLCYTDENNYISEGPTRVTLRATSPGHKASVAKTPCNSSDDLMGRRDEEESLQGAMASGSCSKPSLRSRVQFSKTKRPGNSYKKPPSSNNKVTSRSAESSNVKRKNPILKKIIETMKDKISDNDAEQKIYSYLDFIDQNGTSSPFFISKSSREHSKFKRAKCLKAPLEQYKSLDEQSRAVSRKDLIDQKMTNFKKQLETFTKAFKMQREENTKLKKFITRMVNDQNESLTLSPHE